LSCDPERVTGFVDGELDAASAADVAAHLETCPGCREQAEAERALRSRLRGLEPPPLPDGLEARVRSAARSRRFAPATLVRWALPVAATLVLGAWVRGHAPFVAWEIARDHQHCFSIQPLPARVWSDEPGRVAGWFEEQGTHLPRVPERVGELTLVGARFCPLPDLSSAPHVYYASATGRVSVFVVPHGVRFTARFSARTRGSAVRLLRLEGETVGLVGESESQVAAFESELLPVIAALTSAPRLP
jgi:anti-sigma factor RsiW